MTKIRLTRTGSTHQPYYRVIVTDSRNRRDGQFIELLGSYDPLHNGLNINQERASYWVSVGAQPSNTVITLLTKAGVEHPYKVRRKPVKPQAAAAEPVQPEATVAGDETVEEAPLSDEAAAAESPADEPTPEDVAAESAAEA